MDDINDLLDNISIGGTVKGIDTNLSSAPEIDLSWLFKIPAIVILVGNVFFSVILFLRARILEDTVSTAQSKLVKSLLVIYLILTMVGTLISVLFFIFA